jgi:hypothetical protein
MLKKGDVHNDADDNDEVRTSTSQNHATTTLTTEEFSSGLSIDSSPLILVERHGGGIDGQRDNYRWYQLGS